MLPVGRHVLSGVLLLVAPLLLVSPGLADAKANGAKAGAFRVHPSVQLEGRFDSNLYRENSSSDPAVDETPTAVGYMRLLPGLEVENPSPGKVDLSGRVGAEVRQYFDELINDQQDSVGFEVTGRLKMALGSAASLVIQEDLRRQLEPGQGFTREPVFGENAELIDRGCSSPCTATFWRNTTKAGVKIAPGGGRLAVTPSYQFSLSDFEGYDETDWTQHLFALDVNWGFLPKTALVVESSIGLLSYTDTPYTEVADSTPVRTMAGLRGLITAKISVDIAAGYGHSMHGSGESFQSVIGRAVLTYKISERFRIRGGYYRDYQGSPISNFFDSHRGLLDAKVQLMGNLAVAASVNAWVRDFSTIQATGVNIDQTSSQSGRTDVMFLSNLALDWHPNDWLVVKAGYRVEMLQSGFGAQSGTDNNYAAYGRHQLYTALGVRM